LDKALQNHETENTMKTGPILATLVAVAIAASSATVLAETVTYKATLAGANEVPANDSPAAGEAVATYDTGTRMLTWVVTFADTTGPLIGAHIHGPAETSANAGVMLPFKSKTSPIEGSAVLTPEQAGFLEAGQTYVNLHTERYPGGELRGNLVK
jgi:CHRD domain